MLTTGFLVCSNTNCNSDRGFREDLRRGDIVCTLCGRVACEKTIDFGSEWRNFDDGQDKSRAEKVGDEEPLGTLTKVGKKKGKDEAVRIHQPNLTASEQKLIQAYSKISEFADRLELKDNIKAKAKALYKEFETKKIKKTRGSNGDAIILATLYLACKVLGTARTFKELSIETGIKEQEIKKMYTILSKHLHTTTAQATPLAPYELVIRICSHIGLEFRVKSLAQQIAKNTANKLEGKSPSTIAAASIYMAVNHLSVSCSEKDIAKAASISPSTIKNTFKQMVVWKDDIIPPISS